MPVMVYGESTPNPNILKFVLNFNLLPGSVEYLEPSDAGNSPLSQMLFSYPEIKSVFISSNFISITKNIESDWYELMPRFREAIINFFKEGKAAFSEDEPLGQPQSEFSPIDKQIIDILDEFVRPAVEGDGGEIVFKSFTDGKVTLILKGACRGCPSSALTLKSGIENLLKQMIPEVKEVVAEAI
jgi:NFU1 iron-sulfur cluster scaffold homolog, mitochondrial